MTPIPEPAIVLAWPAAVLLLTALAAADSVRELFPRSRDLLSRLALVRLYPMLARRHIAVPAYLRQRSARKIAAQIQACETCMAKDRCDAALASEAPADFGFCPSSGDLAALRIAQGAGRPRHG